MRPSRCAAPTARRATIRAAITLACVSFAAGVLPGGARAQALVEASPPENPIPPSVPVMKGWPGLMGLLYRDGLGLPVVAAGYGASALEAASSGAAPSLPQPPAALPPGTALAPSDAARLAGFARQARTAEVPYTVLRAGQAYVIAPATREAPRRDMERLGPWDFARRGELMDRFIASLSDADAARLSAPDGIRVDELSPAARSAFREALQPTLRIVRVSYNPPSRALSPTDRWNPLPRATLSRAPADWSNAQVRARLTMNMLGVPSMSGSSGQRFPSYSWHELSAPTGVRFEEVRRSLLPDFGSRGSDRLIGEVPNTFKPSDLSGAAGAEATVGVQGIFRLKDLLRHIGTRTGLKLNAQTGYREMPVFVGTESLPCGDVLDGLRLALEAAWRRTGDTYFLVWDRDGYAAVQQRALETTRDSADRMEVVARSMRDDPTRLRLAERLPFDEGGPFVPTPAQRERLMAPPGPIRTGRQEALAAIRFSELLPAQQEALRGAVKREMEISALRRRNSLWSGTAPITGERLDESVVRRGARIAISVNVPGTGWVECPASWNYGVAEPSPERPRATPIGTAKPIPASRSVEPWKGGPFVLPAPERAVMVPPLEAATLRVLAPAMAKRGFQTLFYPVLSNGYTTFPTTAFPPMPAGTARYAQAVQIAKRHGIRVAGYVETLAWRRGREPGHWLDQHPEWVDVDVLGRTRAAWVEAHGQNVRWDIEPVAYVRVREPEVERRLRLLVRDFARQPDADAIAFLNWDPVSSRMGAVNAPPLGYALPDRLAVMSAAVDDPLDQIAYSATYTPRSLDGYNIDRSIRGMHSRPPADSTRPYVALIEALLQAAKESRADWTTYLFEPSPYIPNRPGWSLDRKIQAPNTDAYVANPFQPGAVGSTHWTLAEPLERAVARARGEGSMGQDTFRSALEANPDLRLAIVDLRGDPSNVLERMDAFVPIADYPGGTGGVRIEPLAPADTEG